MVLNWNRIVGNFYEIGAPVPHWLPRQQVIDPPVDLPPLPELNNQENSTIEQSPELNGTNTQTTEPPPSPQTKKLRSLYFISVDQNGNLHLTALEKSLPDTEAPLTETLTALLNGLSEKELEQGLISLIPEKAKILSVTIQNGTAYINFNEDFLYNVYGREGFSSQLKQIVWTATQFPTVKKVQILIEGRRESYMGDNIWIGDILTRENLAEDRE